MATRIVEEIVAGILFIVVFAALFFHDAILAWLLWVL